LIKDQIPFVKNKAQKKTDAQQYLNMKILFFLTISQFVCGRLSNMSHINIFSIVSILCIPNTFSMESIYEKIISFHKNSIEFNCLLLDFHKQNQTLIVQQFFVSQTK
jgi:hypothetical protein